MWAAAALAVAGIFWSNRVLARTAFVIVAALVLVALLGGDIGYRSVGIPAENALIGSLFLLLPYAFALVLVERLPQPPIDLGYANGVLALGAASPILIQGDPMHPIYATLAIGLLAAWRRPGWPVAGILVAGLVAANQLALIATDGFVNPWPVRTLSATLVALVLSVLAFRNIRHIPA